MATKINQTPDDHQVPINNAAKDDTVHTTFSISDLLANDPGGAAKVDITKQFFFGDSADDQTVLGQAAYRAAHHIVDNGDGTFSADSDFSYFVQIGNKGTWSEANVHVIPDPVIQPHSGGALFTENFDAIPAENVIVASGSVWEQVNLDAAHGWVGGGYSELGADGYLGIPTTSGAAGSAFWFDTQQSPGPVNLSHTFQDQTAAVAGKTSVLEFDIAKQDGDGHVTSPNESFEFRIDGVTVAHVNAADLVNADQMYHYSIDISGYALAGDTHTLQMIDTTNEFTFNGFSVDSIAIHDWVV